jgi:hypothetical protein
MKRAIMVVVVCLLVVLGAAAVRARWAGGDALDRGDAAMKRGDVPAAIGHWERAARWYVPVVGVTGDALARLERVATEADRAGDSDTAFAAWQAVRSATLAIRGASAAFDDHRARADARLAVLLGAQVNPSAGATAEARTAWHAAVLAGTTRPTRAWLLLALAGLAALLAGGTIAALAHDRDTRDARQLRRGLLLSAAARCSGWPACTWRDRRGVGRARGSWRWRRRGAGGCGRGTAGDRAGGRGR